MAFSLPSARFPLSLTSLRRVALGAVLLPAVLLVTDPARAEMDLPLESPIVKLMMSQNWPEFKRTLMGGTNANSTDQSKQPLLVLAARNNMPQAVEILLEQQAKIDLQDSFGNSALLWAADQNNVEILEKLIRAGAKRESAEPAGGDTLDAGGGKRVGRFGGKAAEERGGCLHQRLYRPGCPVMGAGRGQR